MDVSTRALEVLRCMRAHVGEQVRVNFGHPGPQQVAS